MHGGKASTGLCTGFSTGQRVTWLHRPRGGYGYSQAIPAVVVRVTSCRVVIEVPTRAGGSKLVRARPSSLRQAHAMSHPALT